MEIVQDLLVELNNVLKGYNTLTALVHHHTFGQAASELLLFLHLSLTAPIFHLILALFDLNTPDL